MKLKQGFRSGLALLSCHQHEVPVTRSCFEHRLFDPNVLGVIAAFLNPPPLIRFPNKISQKKTHLIPAGENECLIHSLHDPQVHVIDRVNGTLLRQFFFRPNDQIIHDIIQTRYSVSDDQKGKIIPYMIQCHSSDQPFQASGLLYEICPEKQHAIYRFNLSRSSHVVDFSVLHTDHFSRLVVLDGEFYFNCFDLTTKCATRIQLCCVFNWPNFHSRILVSQLDTSGPKGPQHPEHPNCLDLSYCFQIKQDKYTVHVVGNELYPSLPLIIQNKLYVVVFCFETFSVRGCLFGSTIYEEFQRAPHQCSLFPELSQSLPTNQEAKTTLQSISGWQAYKSCHYNRRSTWEHNQFLASYQIYYRPNWNSFQVVFQPSVIYDYYVILHLPCIL